MVSAKSPGWNWLPCQESGGSSRQPRSPMMFVAFIYNFKISITLYLNNIYIYTYIIYIYLFMYLDLGYTWCYPLNSSGKSGSLIWGQVLWSYKGPLVTGYRKHCAFWPDIYIYIWFWPRKTSLFSAFKAVLFNRWQVRMMMEYVWGRAMAGFNGESPEELSLNRLSVESQSFWRYPPFLSVESTFCNVC